MDYKLLKENIKKYNLQKYISLLKGYTLFDKQFSIFYLEKCKIIWRILNGFSNKYKVFKNIDLEYGKIDNIKIFKNIDAASAYLWEIFIEYVQNGNSDELIKLRKQLLI